MSEPGFIMCSDLANYGQQSGPEVVAALALPMTGDTNPQFSNKIHTKPSPGKKTHVKY